MEFLPSIYKVSPNFSNVGRHFLEIITFSCLRLYKRYIKDCHILGAMISSFHISMWYKRRVLIHKRVFIQVNLIVSSCYVIFYGSQSWICKKNVSKIVNIFQNIVFLYWFISKIILFDLLRNFLLLFYGFKFQIRW